MSELAPHPHPASHPPEVADETLVARMARRDTGALSAFMDRHGTVLYSLVVRILADESRAQNAYEDAMVALWERAASYDPELGRPLSWALQVTREIAAARARADRTRANASRRTVAVRATGNAVGGDSLARNSYATPDASLSPQPGRLSAHTHLFELAYFGGLTVTEMAVQLGQSPAAIRTQIYQGMLDLRDSLRRRP